MNTKTSSNRFLYLINIVAFVGVVTVNALSNALPLNGRTAGEISDALPSFFTPAGYTFSIWGAIYLALTGFIIYQALPAQRQRPLLRRVGWLFVASSVANSAWLFAWHYGYYLLSVGIMVSLLLILITLYLRLRIGTSDLVENIADRAFVHLPFSLYLGWITVATIANAASVLAYLGWNGFGIDGQTWSAILMFVAVVVAGLLLFNRRNIAYAAVLIWALFGIRAAYPDVAIVANSALVASALIALLAAVGYLRRPQPGLSLATSS